MGAYRPAAMSDRLKRWGKEVDRNLFTTTDADRLKFAAKGCDSHSLVGDPMFMDPAHGDFRVKDGSPALALGFRNFPMDRFGVERPALKAIARTPRIDPPAISKAEASRDTYGWRGATLRPIGGEEFSAYGTAKGQGGVAVIGVGAGSLAERDGFRPGDLILRLDGRPTRTIQESLAIAGRSYDSPVAVTISAPHSASMRQRSPRR